MPDTPQPPLDLDRISEFLKDYGTLIRQEAEELVSELRSTRETVKKLRAMLKRSCHVTDSEIDRELEKDTP